MKTLIMLVVISCLTVCQMQSQWVQQQVPNGLTMLLSIDFSDSANGIAGGYNAPSLNFTGRIIYTTDGGVNWLPSVVPDSARSIVTVKLVAPGTAFALGAYNGSGTSPHPVLKSSHPLAYGYKRYFQLLGIDGTSSYFGFVLKSTDGGQSWFPLGQLPDSVTYLFGASFVTSMLGYVTGETSQSAGSACVLKTADGGLTWTVLATPDSVLSLRDICFVDSVSGVAVGYSYGDSTETYGLIIRTTDGGVTWKPKSFPGVNNFVSVSFSSPLVGYASGPSNADSVSPLRGVVYKTTDGGASWMEVPVEGTDSIFENYVRFAWGTDVGVMYGIHPTLNSSGDQPLVARTTNGGATWMNQTLTGLPPNVILIGGKLLDPVNGYISGGDVLSTPMILHTTNGGVDGVKEKNRNLPNAFHLEQNYPNPFNPITLIKYDLPKSVYVRLTIFDVLGREVATLVNELQQPGSKSAKFDGTGVPSGVYFYRLEAGLFSETKKLLLLR